MFHVKLMYITKQILTQTMFFPQPIQVGFMPKLNQKWCVIRLFIYVYIMWFSIQTVFIPRPEKCSPLIKSLFICSSLLFSCTFLCKQK